MTAGCCMRWKTHRPPSEREVGPSAEVGFRGRTESDLYLRIMDHRHYLTEETGRDPVPDAALVTYVTRFGPRCARCQLLRHQASSHGNDDKDATRAAPAVGNRTDRWWRWMSLPLRLRRDPWTKGIVLEVGISLHWPCAEEVRPGCSILTQRENTKSGTRLRHLGWIWRWTKGSSRWLQMMWHYVSLCSLPQQADSA